MLNKNNNHLLGVYLNLQAKSLSALDAQAFESLPFAVCLRDEQGAVVRANACFETMQSLLQDSSELLFTYHQQRQQVLVTRQEQQSVASDIHGKLYVVTSVLLNFEGQTLVSTCLESKVGETALSKALADSQLALQTYLDHSHEMIVRVDLIPPIDSRGSVAEQVEHFVRYAVIGDCNDLYAQFYGFEQRHALIGKPLPYFSNLDEYRQAAQALIEKNYEAHNQKLMQVTTQGEERWVEYSTHGVWDGPCFKSFWGAQRDITLLHHNQAELSLREQRYRDFISRSVEAIAHLDLDPAVDISLPEREQVKQISRQMRVTECNKAWAAQYGNDSPDTVKGRFLSEFEALEDLEGEATALIRNNYDLNRRPQEVHLTEGGFGHFRYSLSARIEDGFLQGMWLVQQDITQEVNDAEALRLSEARYASFVENSTDALCRYELEPPVSLDLPIAEQVRLGVERLRIAECNQEWAKLYDIANLDDLVGKRLVDLDPREDVEDAYLDFVRSGYVVKHKEQHNLTRQGGWIHVRYSVTPIIKKNALEGLWHVEEDITEIYNQNLALEQSELRRREFFSSSFTPAVRYKLDPPMPIALSAAEQEEWLFRNICFLDVNQAFVDWSGVFATALEYQGVRLCDLGISPDLDREIWQKFVASGYRLKAKDWHLHTDVDSAADFETGTDIYFDSEHRGIVENETLIEVWASYNDTTASREYLRKMEFQARHDALTGLPNREALHDHLSEYLPTACPSTPLVLMFIDLDLFKEVNDALGHHAGDDLLKLLGPRLESVTKGYKNSIVARLGGDEFAVSVCVTKQAEAIELAQDLLLAIKQPFDLAGVNVLVGASIGIASAPIDSCDATDLMRFADVAMYRAKSGRIGFAVFDAKIDKQSSRRLELLSELRAGLEADGEQSQLQLYYQPKITLGDQTLYGCEALMRWFHPEYGFISPAEFIPIAEATDLIHPLTEWVLNQALKHCRLWWGESQLPVAVNFSTQNLLNTDIVSMVAQALKQHGLPSRALEIEVTESALMQNPEKAHAILKDLRGLGVSIAIDDFGTGYSSLAYLKSLPVTTLKIDYSFVRELISSSEDKVIVDSVIQLGQNFGLNIVAEGVEDQATQDLLNGLGCDLAQGYHIAKPMPLDKFLSWIEEYPA